jgi:hypothetical protein
MISNDIYIHIISKYLTDQDHVHLCCANQYKYKYWSSKTSLQQTYNEQVLINQIYRSSIFRSQVRYINVHVHSTKHSQKKILKPHLL